MQQEGNPVTLILYSSPERAIPPPSARRAVAPSTQPAAERRPQPFAQRAKPLAAKPPLNPYAERRIKKILAIHGFPVYNKDHNKTKGKRACVLWYAGLFYFGGGCDDSALWGRINKRERQEQNRKQGSPGNFAA